MNTKWWLTLVLVLAAIPASAGVTRNGGYVNGGYVNGGYVNGGYVNGGYVNGGYVNGGYVNGTYIDGMSQNGFAITSVALSGSMLYGYKNGQWISGTQFVGSQITATTSGNDKIRLTLQTARHLSGSNSDVWLYTLNYVTSWTEMSQECEYPYGCYTVYTQHNDTNWICGTDSTGNPIEATAVNGMWDYRQGVHGAGGKISASSNVVTFGCLDGAIGKCAASGVPNGIGYKPWSGEYEMGAWHYYCYAADDCEWYQDWTWRSYQPLHEACVRMVRADYCGDGVSHTVNGTQIDVQDELPSRVQTYSTYWWSEANWVPGGMTCINEARSSSSNWSGTCPNGGPNVEFNYVSVFDECSYRSNTSSGATRYNSVADRNAQTACVADYDCWYAHECSQCPTY